MRGGGWRRGQRFHSRAASDNWSPPNSQVLSKGVSFPSLGVCNNVRGVAVPLIYSVTYFYVHLSIWNTCIGRVLTWALSIEERATPGLGGETLVRNLQSMGNVE